MGLSRYTREWPSCSGAGERGGNPELRWKALCGWWLQTELLFTPAILTGEIAFQTDLRLAKKTVRLRVVRGQVLLSRETTQL